MKKGRSEKVDKEFVDYENVLHSVDYITELPVGRMQSKPLPLEKPIRINKIRRKAIVIDDQLMTDMNLAAIRPVRKCVDCDKVLPPERYRHCNKCVKNLPIEV